MYTDRTHICREKGTNDGACEVSKAKGGKGKERKCISSEK